ncbi:hypothetical protein H6F42_00975 [Pseudanabaena sp. FACHB-1998]|uniref:hypothetical protein n=1 Tax=Pseudanabaena sp. FACHB-1998 TaxID=2692858 RepID=UPI0016808996|nr:hypothetical protein [Pseudanabaena sp. FACHB-1998]MBD2175487.1 hypothetical protein [Pseudanabaena sp. FACHB-1998]
MTNKLAITPLLLVACTTAIAPFSLTNSAIAEETINIPQQLVEPSLWWKSQRLEEGWVEGINIEPETRKAIITVNTTRWGASDYLKRFSFLFKLGTEAQKQNFNVVLHNRRSQKLAEYSSLAEAWHIEPKSLGAEPFRVVAPQTFQQQF